METRIQNVSLDLVDDPRRAVRDTVDDDGLDELKASMKAHGLIQPITVCKRGDRYEVIAGHRRTRAARLLQWVTIPAIIREVDERKATVLKIHENMLRRDVDPVEEARFIGEYIAEQKMPPAEFAAMISRSEQYVKDRLEVFAMPDYLLDALKHRRISLGAALWLGRIPKEATRKYYTHWAELNGVSVAGAKKWYMDLSATNYDLPATDVEVQDEGTGVKVVRKVIACAACGVDVFLDEADSVFTCRGLKCQQING